MSATRLITNFFEEDTEMRNRHAITAPAADQVSSPLKIVYRDIDELILQLKNVRQHPKKQIQQIARSIEAFGFNVPFQIDGNSRLIAGHGRLAACQMLGIRRVPTICLEHLSEAQSRAFAIAENKIAEGGRWDRSCLAEELQFLSEINLEFELDVTGFDVREIQLLTNGADLGSNKKTNVLGEISDAHSEIPVSSPDDVWVLANHRLICGSALDQQNYSVLMNTQHAAAVFTHLPRASNENPESLLNLFSQLCEYSDRAAYHFVITENLLITGLLVAADRAGLELADLCIAIKEAVHPGRLYQNQRDLVFVLEKRNVKQSRSDFERTNVWCSPHNHPRRRTSVPLESNVIHNQLPPGIIADAFTDCTEPGDIILDPFLGNATTLIAAEQTGRICYAIEADPFAIDRAVRGWQQLTGFSAMHLNQGVSFDQIAEVRNVKA